MIYFNFHYIYVILKSKIKNPLQIIMVVHIYIKLVTKLFAVCVNLIQISFIFKQC